MSLKLTRALPAALNCLKSARILFVSSECPITIAQVGPRKLNFCCGTQQTRCLATESSKRHDEKQKSPIKKIYFGPLAPHVRAVKLFSLSSSVVGLSVQPVLYQEIVATGNVPVILAAYSFIGFFTVVTPLLLHLITRKYITELSYNEEKGTYVAKTLNFFCRTKEVEFRVKDVFVPDIPGMFVTFHVKGKPLFVDPRNFEVPEHYAKLMGFDKAMDFKLYETEASKSEAPTSPTGSSK